MAKNIKHMILSLEYLKMHDEGIIISFLFMKGLKCLNIKRDF